MSIHRITGVEPEPQPKRTKNPQRVIHDNRGTIRVNDRAQELKTKKNLSDKTQ